MILGCLRAHPTLREGMAAAGVRFAQLRGTASRVPDFGAALKEIMAMHRAARKARHKPENRAAVRAMVAAGVPSGVARTALRRMHGDRRGPCADPVTTVAVETPSPSVEDGHAEQVQKIL